MLTEYNMNKKEIQAKRSRDGANRKRQFPGQEKLVDGRHAKFLKYGMLQERG